MSRFEKAKPPLLRDLENVGAYFEEYDLEIDAKAEHDRLVTDFERLL